MLTPSHRAVVVLNVTSRGTAMKKNKAVVLPLVLAALGLCIGGPTAAYTGGTGRGGDQRVGVGAMGSAVVESNSAIAQVASTGCEGRDSDTVLPSTIRVLRRSGRVDVVPFKEYVENVLPNEWIAGWSPASLEAGAMAVKSFAWYWVNHSAYRISGDGECYDVTDDTRSQVYRPGSATAATNAAVDATWRARIVRGGGVLQAHYCSTSTACGAWVDGDWMSQHGTQALARQGDDYATILRHYYSGISITGAGSSPVLQVGVVRRSADRHDARVWRTAPSYRSASSAKRAGHVNVGMKHFSCQVIGAELRAEGYHNRWWLRTDDDSGNRNVWVNAIYIDAVGRSSEGRIPRVPVCSPAAPKSSAKSAHRHSRTPTTPRTTPRTHPKPTTEATRKKPAPSGTVARQVLHDAPSYLLPVAWHRVGVLHRGTAYLSCQSEGLDDSFRGQHSNWWLKTDDDSGNRNVWVNASYIGGGLTGRAVPHVPIC